MNYKQFNLYLTGSTVQQDTRRPSFTGVWCVMQGNETEGVWGGVSILVMLSSLPWEKLEKTGRSLFFQDSNSKKCSVTQRTV